MNIQKIEVTESGTSIIIHAGGYQILFSKGVLEQYLGPVFGKEPK